MAEITAALVKELRETSGAGMMDCKRALTETAGNLQDAVDWLRKKGLAAATCMASWRPKGASLPASAVDSRPTSTPILPRPGATALWT